MKCPNCKIEMELMYKTPSFTKVKCNHCVPRTTVEIISRDKWEDDKK